MSRLDNLIRPAPRHALPPEAADCEVSRLDDDFKALLWCVNRMSTRQEVLLREVRSLKQKHQESRDRLKRKYDAFSFSLLAVALGAFFVYVVLKSGFLGFI